MEKLMGSINETWDRAEREGFNISKNLLRSMVKSGILPSVKVGKNQYLINFEVLRSLLYTGSPQIPEQATPRTISAIPEKLTAAK